MATQAAPRPLTDQEFANLSDDQLEKLGFKDALKGAPATFGGTVYPNPDNVKPMLDTDRGTPTRMPDGVTLSSPTYKGKAKMDTSNPPKAQLIPQGSQEIQAKTTGTPVPAGPSLLEQLADPDTHGTPPAPTPAGATSLLEQLAAGTPPGGPDAMPSGLPAGSSATDATKHTLDQVLEGAKEGGKGLLSGLKNLVPGLAEYGVAQDIKDGKPVVANPLAGATQIPGAIHDINQSPDAAQLYADAAARTGGNALVQGVAGVAGEEIPGKVSAVDTDALHTALKKTGVNAINKYVPIKDLMDFTKNYEAAKAANGVPKAEAAPASEAPSPKSTPQPELTAKQINDAKVKEVLDRPTGASKPTPRVRTPVTGAPATGAPDVAAANGYTRPAVVTNPQDIQAAVDDIVKGKTGRQAPLRATELEGAMKSGTPVQTPFDVTEGARATIDKDIAARVGTPDKPASSSNNGAAPKAKSPATQSKISGETEALRNRPTTVDGQEVGVDTDLTDALQKSIDAVKNNKPHWAYRSRDVGEEGIPATNSPAHAAATLEEAKRIAPGREYHNGAPQEIVRFDLNKLKPHQYSTFSGPKDTPWIKVHGGLPESAVEKVK